MNGPTLEEVLEEVLVNLKSGDPAERRYAAEDAAEVEDPACIPALVAALKDPVVAVREAATESLIAIGTEEVCEALVEHLGTDDAAMRNHAVEILEGLRAVSIPTCVRLCSSPSHDLRKIAVDTLGKTEETREFPEAFEKVVDALDDEHIIDFCISNAIIEGAREGGCSRCDPLVLPNNWRSVAGARWRFWRRGSPSMRWRAESAATPARSCAGATP